MLLYILVETSQHSDRNAHIYGSIKIGNEIFVREKEFSKGHHLANVVQFVGGGWLKVRWQWRGWNMANVHMSWILIVKHNAKGFMHRRMMMMKFG